MSVPPNVLVLFISPEYGKDTSREIYNAIRKKFPKNCHVLAAATNPIQTSATPLKVSAMALRVPSSIPLKTTHFTIPELHKLLEGCPRAAVTNSDIVLTRECHDLAMPCGAEATVFDEITKGEFDARYRSHIILGRNVNSSQVNAVVRCLQAKNPDAVVSGGVTDCNIEFGKTENQGEITVLSVGGGVGAECKVARGGRAVGGTFRIEEAVDNRVLKVRLVGAEGVEDMNKVLFDVLQEVGGQKECNPLMLGVTNDEGENAEYTMTQIYSLSHDSVLLSNTVTPGQYCQFFIHDPKAVEERQTSNLPSADALILFQSHLTPHKLPLPLPAIGMTCSSEIGPLGLTRKHENSSTPAQRRRGEDNGDVKTEVACEAQAYTTVTLALTV